MHFFEPFYLFDNILFPLLLTLDPLLVVFFDLPEFSFILGLHLYDLLLVVLALFLLFSFQLIILGALLHHILSLVGIVLLKSIFELFLLGSDLLVDLFTSDVLLFEDGVVFLVELCLV